MLLFTSFAVGLSALVGLLARPIARRSAPAAAVRLLVGTGVIVAGGWCWAVALLASTALGQFPLVAWAGQWSPAQLGRLDPVPIGLGWGAALALAVMAAAGAETARRRLRATWSSWQACRQMPPGAGSVVVLADEAPTAVAVPGLRGRVVVSRGMLRALEPEQRRALLAHERSHLRHRHDLWVSAAHMIARVDPLLVPLVRAVDEGVERWADEDAAAEVGDRALTAEAIASAALATVRFRPSTTSLGEVSLAGAAGHVTRRIDALLMPSPRAAPRLTAVLVAVVAASAIVAVIAGYEVDRLFDTAIRATHLAAHR